MLPGISNGVTVADLDRAPLKREKRATEEPSRPRREHDGKKCKGRSVAKAVNGRGSAAVGMDRQGRRAEIERRETLSRNGGKAVAGRSGQASVVVCTRLPDAVVLLRPRDPPVGPRIAAA